MKHLWVVPILISAMPVLAFRATTQGDPKMQGVEGFLNWSSENCVDCGKTIGSLIEGIYHAKFLVSSDWQGRTLTVKLTEKHLYGQVALKSRLPIRWKIDETLTFTFGESLNGEIQVQVKGLGIKPSPQGLQLYEAAMSYSNLNGANCVDSEECIVKEEAAAGKYLKDNWKKHIKKQDGLVTQLLKITYGSTGMYLAMRTMGETMWGEIFYSFINPCPAQITRFVFKNGQIGAISESTDDARYIKYNLPQKMKRSARRAFILNSMEKKLANKFARSSSNFAKMIAYGQVEDGKEAGDVDAIANLFTWCAGTAVTELPHCEGKMKGRLGWTPSPKN